MTAMMGININCRKYPFLTWILGGRKTIETRNTPSLRPYLGKRVGLVQTGCGKALLVGFATITEEIVIRDREHFALLAPIHCINDKMPEYAFKNIKYCYALSDVERIDPVPVSSRGIVARQI